MKAITAKFYKQVQGWIMPSNCQKSTLQFGPTPKSSKGNFQKISLTILRETIPVVCNNSSVKAAQARRRWIGETLERSQVP